MSDAPEQVRATPNGHDQEESLYDEVCRALKTEISEAESVEEFKIRVVKAFSDMDDWPDSKYEELTKELQDWVYDATTTHKSNNTKKRKKSLPVLSGLDPVAADKTKRRGRASLNDDVPAKRGRTRTSGDDCLTRTMKVLVVHATPDVIKAADLVKILEDKHGKEYSTAAVRYAQQAFLTARELMRQHAA